ncbi:hypothetical protein PJP14_29850, partial [Mycobacterium kansasii]
QLDHTSMKTKVEKNEPWCTRQKKVPHRTIRSVPLREKTPAQSENALRKQVTRDGISPIKAPSFSSL